MKLDINIKKAAPDEMGAALDMLKDSAIWLKDKNISQWTQWLKPDDKILGWVKQGFDNNEFYFARLDGKLAGLFRLTWDEDKTWEDRKARAGYLHAFTTDRKIKGEGVGTAMLDWMKEYCRKNNRHLLRLDCHAWSKPLRSYYEKHGFRFVAEKQVSFGMIALYEAAL